MPETIQKKDLGFKKVIGKIHFSISHKPMCLVSKDIKFCTCEVVDYEELPHYRVLHRYNRHKEIQILGSLVMLEDYLLLNFER
jgi:hypothetical protein